MGVPEVGRQLRQVTLDVDAASIPPEERGNGQSMA
jgi:hypothetical protein